ncbi:hypothetical protein V4R08_14815 [Nitrobacter sp. NHB1]|uniref:hypothetical protein n=1 Tax=Nitrobacter sp. NHB1 TaxID=3119830 RepID=UPI0030008819
MRFVFRVIAACTILAAACSSSLAADAKPHHVTIQVDQNDPAIMNIALNNVTNILETYKESLFGNWARRGFRYRSEYDSHLGCGHVSSEAGWPGSPERPSDIRLI